MSNVIRGDASSSIQSIKWLSGLALLTFIGIATYIGFLERRLQGPLICAKGQLETIDECIADESTFLPWDRGGWWYTYAKGKMSKEACTKAGLDINAYEIDYYGRSIKMLKMDCSRAGFVGAKYCYGWQWPTTGGTGVAMMAANDCDNAEFFTASRATMLDGKPTIPKGKNVRHPGIPASDGK